MRFLSIIFLIAVVSGCQVHTGHRDLDGACWLADQWCSFFARGFAKAAAKTDVEWNEDDSVTFSWGEKEEERQDYPYTPQPSFP